MGAEHQFPENFCEIITKTAQIIEKKHTIVLLGILILDGEQYFLELQRKLSTDKKTLQQRLIQLKELGIIDKEIVFEKKVKKSRYSITRKGEEFLKVMESLYNFGK